jgi:preprotein translocase subunit SecA
MYAWRNELMEAEDMSATLGNARRRAQTGDRPLHSAAELGRTVERGRIGRGAGKGVRVALPIRAWLDADHDLHEEPLRERIHAELERAYAARKRRWAGPGCGSSRKAVLLQVLDTHWREHLAAMDYLRQGIHLRGYAQKNPKQEYKREAFDMFQIMVQRIHQEAVGFLARAQFQTEPEPIPAPRRPASAGNAL